MAVHVCKHTKVQKVYLPKPGGGGAISGTPVYVKYVPTCIIMSFDMGLGHGAKL